MVKEKISKNLNFRAPVVTIMGHVDHGKTTLLDYIRKTKIVEKEFGGITQQIRAYQVFFQDFPITFIDTPGHEAFYSMRERGANVTDIIILVVAADDSVMPQTKEVINIWKKTNNHLIVAINKIDLPTANIEKVKSDLANEGVFLEGYGGNIPYVQISAKHGTNVNDLLDLINLVSQLNDLHKFTDLSNADYKSESVVLESYLDKSLGPVHTVIVKAGVLKRGSYIVGGNIYSRVRAIINDVNLTIDEAIESLPVRIVGIPDILNVGEILRTYDNELIARKVSKEKSFNEQRIEARNNFSKAMLSSLLYQEESEGNIRKLNLFVSADTRGSLEAILYSLNKINVPGVELNIVNTKIGLVSINDVDLAKLKNAIIVSFNLKNDYKVIHYAESSKVLFKEYKVIYELLNDVQDSMLSLVQKDEHEEILGEATVLQIFQLNNGKYVLGLRVNKGKLVRNNSIKVLRNDNVIYEGKIVSLKHVKDEMKEINAGLDCGLLFEPNTDIAKPNDKIICVKK